MYTLNILCEEVIKDLSGGDIPSDSPYDPDYVKDHIRDAINEDLKVELLRRKAGGEDDKSMPTQMIATYPVAVAFEKSQFRCYAELPSYFLSLKHNRGIHSVSDIKESLNPMIRVSNPGVTHHLAHGQFERSNFGYYLEGMRVYWMRNIMKENINNVLIKLIIGAPDTINDDTVLPLLPESVGRIKDLAKIRTQNKFPQDRIADGSPNLRPTNQ